MLIVVCCLPFFLDAVAILSTGRADQAVVALVSAGLFELYRIEFPLTLRALAFTTVSTAFVLGFLAALLAHQSFRRYSPTLPIVHQCAFEG